ncbi:MAG: glycosyl hydrolase family 28-related protein [Pyrinomonadaceae bacterium]
MLKINRILLFVVFILLSALTAVAQNKFEGYNLFLDVPDTQKVATCALRYVAPTTDITITDLDRSTPMKISNCGDATTRLTQTNASTAVVRSSSTNFKWCFSGEDKKYRISFKGDQSAGQITYDWIATPETPGIYNLKDFGAIGDGNTDNTIALKSAMAFIASRNGGVLQIPEGDFSVNSTIALPSGIIIQGISGITTLAPTNNVVKKNPSRIRLSGSNRALFRIGECVENVVVKDLELYGSTTDNTYGIEAVGAFLSSQNFYFERVVFQNFSRGFYAHGLPITKLEWQFDYVKFNHCRFVYNRDAGIYSDTINSDWKIEGCMFLNPQRTPTQNANSMHFEHAGLILVQDTFGGGFLNALGGTYLDVTDSANISVINCQTEQMTAAFVYNGAELQYAGDYSYPITFINNIFGASIIFKARRTFVSTGNLYGPKTFQADARLRVYSTGDRFCYDGYTLGCQGVAAINGFDKATVIFKTGQLDEGSVKGSPTFFGTDVQFATPVQMPSILQNALPAGKPNGSMVYCSNCRRDTTPCQAGGSGAPAMVVAGQWSCF